MRRSKRQPYCTYLARLFFESTSPSSRVGQGNISLEVALVSPPGYYVCDSNWLLDMIVIPVPDAVTLLSIGRAS
jgi:hypothetical protein